MKYLYYILIVFVSFSFLSIDGNEKEVQNILNRFQKEYAKKNISMEFEMYYLTHSNSKEEIETGLIQIGEKSYFIRRNEFIDFYDPFYNISINNYNKSILVSNSSHSFDLDKKFQVDSMFSSINNFDASYKENNNHYELITKNEYYDCTYFFTKSNCHLFKIIYSLKNDEENKSFNVNFKNIDTDLSDNKIINTHKEIIRVKRKEIKGIGLYSNYTIKTL